MPYLPDPSDWSSEIQSPQGIVEPGNIDLNHRPIVKNSDGSISTVRSMSFEQDGREVLVPTVSDDGRLLSDAEAIDLYRKTGKHLGVFDNPDNATKYAEALHKDQEHKYLPEQIYLRSPLGGPVERPPVPDLRTTIVDGFRAQNAVVNAVRMLGVDPKTEEPVPGYNAFDEIKGTPYEPYGSRFTFSQSPAETSRLKSWIDQENATNRELDAAGHLGTAARILGGMIDAPSLLAAGTIYKGVRAGAALRTMGSTALAGAEQTAIQEGVLQTTQTTRTPQEGLINVASGTVLAGILGGALGMIVSKAEREVLVNGIDRLKSDLSSTTDRSAGSAEADRNLTLAPIVPPIVSKAYKGAQNLVEKVPYVGKAVSKVMDIPEHLSTKSGPSLRIMTGDFNEAKKGYVELGETPLVTQGNKEFIPTSPVVPLEREIRLGLRKADFHMNNRTEELFRQFRFGTNDVKFAKFKAAISAKFGKEGMTYDKFLEEIDYALRHGDRHDIPEVQTAAQEVFRPIIEAEHQRAISMELLEDKPPLGAESYAPRWVVKEKLVRNKPDFIDRYTTWRHSDQAIKYRIQEQLRIENENLQEAIRLESAEREATTRKRIEQLLGQWEGKTAKEAQAALAKRGEAEIKKAERGAEDGEKSKSADVVVDKAVREILDADLRKTDKELADEAEQTYTQYMGTPDGTLPKDDPIHGAMVPRAKRGRGPLMARTNPMPDDLLLDFIDRNPLRYTMKYLRSMMSDLGMHERTGDFEGTSVTKAIQEETARKMNAATTPAERQKIHDAGQAMIADYAGVRDRLKGIYGFSTHNILRKVGEYSQLAGDYDVGTNMGSSGISQIPDMGNVIARYAFSGGLAPAFKSFVGYLSRTSDTFKQAKAEMGPFIAATELISNSRGRELADMGDVYHPTAKAARILRTGAEATMVLSGTAIMTDLERVFASIAASTAFLKAAKAVARGRVSQKQITMLASANIDEGLAKKIWDEFSKEGGGRITPEGAYLTNTDNWDVSARKFFEAAIGRDVDIAVATPGEEKPLWMSTPGLSLIGKYKSFVAAANTRILLANLQRRDASSLSGVIALIGLGMMSSAIRSELRGFDASNRRPIDWIKEGVDQSQLTGWLGELNAMAAQTTGNSIDLWRLAGADRPYSRYANRSALGSLLGPVAGKVENMVGVTGAAFSRDDKGESGWTSSDTHKLRQLIPLQNLFYIRGLIDQMETGANQTFGIPQRAH